MRLLFRPGWRLRCVDPPIAWLQFRDEDPPAVAIRLQLTTYLTSRLADAVRVKDTQLAVTVGGRRFVVPSIGATDEAEEPFAEDRGYEVGNAGPHHALVTFLTDAPDLVQTLGREGSPLPVSVEAQLNLGIAFREIATLDLSRPGLAPPRGDWQQVGTGRQLDR